MKITPTVITDRILYVTTDVVSPISSYVGNGDHIIWTTCSESLALPINGNIVGNFKSSKKDDIFIAENDFPVTAITFELAIRQEFSAGLIPLSGLSLQEVLFPNDLIDEKKSVGEIRKSQLGFFMRLMWAKKMKNLIGDRAVVVWFRQPPTFLACDSSPGIGGVFYAEMAIFVVNQINKEPIFPPF